jgi:transcriptional regulator with XRE-family HTH domain
MSELEQNFDFTKLGTRIREIRVQRGITQAELGRRIASQIGRRDDYSQATISDLERGKPHMLSVDPETLAKVLKVPLETVSEVLSAEQIEFLRKKAATQKQIDDLRFPRTIGGRTTLSPFPGSEKTAPVRLSRKLVNPTERLMLRSLDRLLGNPSVDNGVKVRLTSIINSQMDLVEDLTAENPE